MLKLFSTAALASALLLGVALSARAAEEKKAPPAKAEKSGEMEKKPAATAKMSGGSEETRKIQEALKAKGNDPGAIDGRMGPKTRAAIKQFQESSGLKGSGRMDSQTAEKLGVQMASTGKETKAAKASEPMGKGPEPMSKEPSKEKK